MNPGGNSFRCETCNITLKLEHNNYCLLNTDYSATPTIRKHVYSTKISSKSSFSKCFVCIINSSILNYDINKDDVNLWLLSVQGLLTVIAQCNLVNITTFIIHVVSQLTNQIAVNAFTEYLFLNHHN